MKTDSNKQICKVSRKCGACQLSNMDYTRQLSFKQANVVKLLHRFGHVEQIIGMAYPYNYRNKVQAAVRRASNGKIITGVYQSSTGGVVVTDDCFINDVKANQIVAFIRRLMPELQIQPFNMKNRKGTVRHIMIRRGYSTNEYMVVFVCIDDRLPNREQLIERIVKKFPEIKTVILNVSRSGKMTLGSYEKILYGKGYIEDILCGKRFRISPRSFYQVNPIQTQVLYQTAVDFAHLCGSERILDAYCGIGTIGIISAGNAKEIVGVELNGDAVKDARINADLNNVKNAHYYKADAAAFMREAAEEKKFFDAVFVDPPRAGCSRIFLQSVAQLKPPKIVYISCNPQTLARDLYFLIHNSYKVNKIQPVDMFPHTSHVECVVLMSRKEN